MTTLRMLKDRYTGRSTGKTGSYGYDDETGLLFEESDHQWQEPPTEGTEEGEPF